MALSVVHVAYSVFIIWTNVSDLLAHMKIDEEPENNLMDINLCTKKIEHLSKIL